MEDAKHSHRITPGTAAGRRTDALQVRGAVPSSSGLITVQWHRERGDLDLENFLLAIYFMRLGTLVDPPRSALPKRYGINGGDIRDAGAAARRSAHVKGRPSTFFAPAGDFGRSQEGRPAR
jgi:hypothetical protein